MHKIVVFKQFVRYLPTASYIQQYALIRCAAQCTSTTALGQATV